MSTIIFLKARDRRDTGTADLFGTHVETRTRKDGVVQAYHVAAPPEPAMPAGHSKKFYVTMIRDKRVARLAGPFDRHEDALEHVEPARAKANEVDPFSEFDAFGTTGITAAAHRPGVLNEHLGVGAARAPVTDGFEFKKFFRDSVVTDTGQAGGKPVRLYHGTAADFSTFKPGGHDENVSGPAIWLTDSQGDIPAAHNVGGYGGKFKDGTNVMPVYVRMENPLIITAANAHEMRAKFADGGPLPKAMTKEVVGKLRSAGFDGIIDQSYKTTEYVVFEPNQIKSAIGNNGEFDPDHPNITKSILFVRP